MAPWRLSILSPRHHAEHTTAALSDLDPSAGFSRAGAGGRHRSGPASQTQPPARGRHHAPAAGGHSRRARAAATICALTVIGTGVGLVATQPGHPAGAATVTTTKIAANADGWVAKKWPGTTYGGSKVLDATNQTGNVQLSYVRFAVPAADVGRIQSAQLVLTRTAHHLAGTVYASAVPSTSWAESSLTARTAPAMTTRLAAYATNNSTTTVSFDVTKSVLAGAEVSFGITSSLTSGVATFNSREAGASGPQLVLTLGPAPAASQPPVNPPASSSSAKPVPPSSSASSVTPPPAKTSSSSSAPAPLTSSASKTSSDPAPPLDLGLIQHRCGAACSGSNHCTVSAKLVPSCGFWFGVAPKAHTSTPRNVALADDVAEVGTPFTVMHTYHVNGDLFPNASDIRWPNSPEPTGSCSSTGRRPPI